MLVVPPVKEPLTTKTLPDTSTTADNGYHPSRLTRSSSQSDQAHVKQTPQQQPNQQQQQQQDDQIPHQQASQCDVPKHLTKQQLNLHHEFLRLGAELMGKSPELFHQALTELTAKHQLSVATPATCVSEILPMTSIARHRHYTSNSNSNSSKSADAAPRVAHRKYTLPAEYAAREFYQCMECKERRPMNTFAADHSHSTPTKSTIRWYCPICDAYYAVTHRGYHIKNRHMGVCNTAQPHARQQQQQELFTCKREREEPMPEEVELLPSSKLPHCSSSNSLCASALSSDEASAFEPWTPAPHSVDSAPASDLGEEPQGGLFGQNDVDEQLCSGMGMLPMCLAPFGACDPDGQMLIGADMETF